MMTLTGEVRYYMQRGAGERVQCSIREQNKNEMKKMRRRRTIATIIKQKHEEDANRVIKKLIIRLVNNICVNGFFF